MLRMPAMFIGHGSPHNLIMENKFTNDLEKMRGGIPTPKAIVVISAHWTTKGTKFTADEAPEQIFDFYGFPKKLYDVRYRPRGEPELAARLASSLSGMGASTSGDWGIDHAATIPLVHLFPEANIPVVEMSLDAGLAPEEHHRIGKAISGFRDEGVLFIGSGNLIHTFRELDPEWNSKPFEWAEKYDERQWSAISRNDTDELVHFEREPTSRRAFQTSEHYLPMLYIVAMRTKEDSIRSIHQGFQHGSISHRSFIIEDDS